jgi:hypothetical protein
MLGRVHGVWMTLGCFMIDMHMWKWHTLELLDLAHCLCDILPWSNGNMNSLVTS